MVPCSHLDTIAEVPAGLDYCEECVPIGATWVHLRQCLQCGKTLCCDASPNKHATGHNRSTGHPIIRAVTPPEKQWMWCYPDELLFGRREEGGELVEFGG